MNILILTNHVNYGGISAYILSLARALHGKDDFKIIVGSRGGDLEKEFAELGVEHIRLPLTTKCEVSPKVFLSFLKLRSFMRKTPVDLIHANTRVTQVLAALVSASTHKPYVSTCHGYFKTRLSRRLFPCWGRKVIAISDQVREHLLYDFYLDPERIELIYNGVDLKKFHPYKPDVIVAQKKAWGLDPSKKIIGHIGRLSSVKGQKFFILAAEQLRRKRQDCQFVIIGEGNEEVPLRKLIHEKKCEDIVFLRPAVADTSLALATMDVFVMPSVQEGLGISILEAQAQGVPVVASRVGGIPTIVEDQKTGLLCPVGDVACFAAAIERFLNDQDFKNKVVGLAVKHVAARFSIALTSENTAKLYKSLA